MNLTNIVCDIISSVGHHKDELRGSWKLAQGDSNVTECTLHVSFRDDKYNMGDYSVTVDNVNNSVYVSPGDFFIDFHDPDSVVMLKTILIQMPIYVKLHNMSNKLSNLFSDTFF